MQIESHNRNIVQKPWGYEYLVYENENIALWFLFIKNKEKTSLHSHPNKTTGLIILDGEAQIKFLSGELTLSKLDKVMIRKGLFHSTTSTSESGTMLFEIETPNNKLDLVRLEDSYGREGKPYEDCKFEIPKQDDCLWFGNLETVVSKTITFANCKLQILNLRNIEAVNDFENDTKIMFLSGGLMTDYDVSLVCPGDIITVEIFKKLSKVFDKLKDQTFVLVFSI